MASTDSPALSPSDPSSPQRRQGLLRRWWRQQPQGAAGGMAEPSSDPLLAAGRQLRQQREQRGLSLRQLAMDTRISTAVLEALERGWRDRLPEPTYLRTMLPLIERHLELPAGCLESALPEEHGARPSPGHQPLLGRFTPGSIDVFTTWQGTVLYGVLTLGLIYALNLQQQRLAARGLLALRPIPPLPPAQQSRPPRPEQALLNLYPELRPLEQAARGQAAAQLRRAQPARPLTTGLLELQLSQASSLSLESAGGLRTNLRNTSGTLSLPLSGRFQLTLQPPPAPGDRILWNGDPLPAVPGATGQFRNP